MRVLGFSVLYDRPERPFAYLAPEAAHVMISTGGWMTGAVGYPFGRGMNFQIAVPDLATVEGRLAADHDNYLSGCGLFPASLRRFRLTNRGRRPQQAFKRPGRRDLDAAGLPEPPNGALNREAVPKDDPQLAKGDLTPDRRDRNDG